MAAVGITRALQRHAFDPTTTALLREWRETVRGKLVAYGQNYEEERQIAWTCMLLPGAPELLDGLTETIGDPTPPGVRLTDVYGNADEVFVDLVAGQWSHMLPHLGESPLVRLTATRPKPDADEAGVLRALISASDSAPVAALLQQRIVQEKLAGVSRTEDMLHSTPAGVDYLIALEGRTIENFRRVLGVADHDVDSYGDREAHRERWVFTRLTRHWDITDAERASLLLDVADTEDEYSTHPRQRGQAASIARAAHVYLFPASRAAQQRLADFEESSKQPAEQLRRGNSITWLEGITLAVMATPPGQLPLILERLFYPHRVERSREPMWKFTTPLMHRLVVDADAVSALVNVLDGTPPAATPRCFPPRLRSAAPPGTTLPAGLSLQREC